ncbi:cytochrome c oxidase assembly protein COX19 isoform X1 [Ovis canadensis]|uniref:cytochrome c oxidase assembly protein COX19 isoform X1 n=1 Tax=Ovis canadensis TaxID=37174 RepID=UPI0038B5457B
MSTAMNFGSKSFQPRPPDKGSFPLDHFGECKSFKEKFMKCLRDNNFENALCRNESKEYLECRMERLTESDALGPVVNICLTDSDLPLQAGSAVLLGPQATDGTGTPGKARIWRFDWWEVRQKLSCAGRKPASPAACS